MAQNGILKSSLAKKYAMAATGLFLCLFLAGHLAGNLQLFTAASDGGRQFNEYAKFMTKLVLLASGEKSSDRNLRLCENFVTE